MGSRIGFAKVRKMPIRNRMSAASIG